MNTQGAVSALSVLIIVAGIAPAAAQQAAPAPASPPAAAPSGQTPPASDKDFLTGLRRIGVLVGQAVQCTPQADRSHMIDDAMELGTKVAVAFGLTAAFNFIAAVGYGSGQAFDQGTCPHAIDAWHNLQHKYLSQ